MLVTQLYTLLAQGWQEVFAQTRTLRRALEHAFALPCVLGRRTLSRTVCALGRAYQDWSADYKIFSRSRWSAEQLFDPVFDEHLRRYPQGPIAVAFDDTQLAKSGKHIPTATWHRDPMSPPFRLNLIFGLRFVQASLLFPHYREGDFAARAYPVGFQEAPSVRKPGRRAPPEALQEYRLVRKLKNLSTQTLEMLRASGSGWTPRAPARGSCWRPWMGVFATAPSFAPAWSASPWWPAVAKTPAFAFPPRRARAAAMAWKPSPPSKSARTPLDPGSALASISLAPGDESVTSRSGACSGNGVP